MTNVTSMQKVTPPASSLLLPAAKYTDDYAARLVPQMYRDARRMKDTKFKARCFDLLNQYLSFDSAGWLVCSRQQPVTTHSIYLHDQPLCLASAFDACEGKDPWLQEAFSSEGHTVPLLKQHKELSVGSSGYGPVCGQHGKFNGLLTALQDKSDGLYTLIYLFRSNIEAPFHERERKFVELLVPHLMASFEQCRYLYMQSFFHKPNSAVCDRQGVMLQTSPGFNELLALEWPNWDRVRALPEELIQRLDSSDQMVFEGQHIVIEMIARGERVYLEAKQEQRNARTHPAATGNLRSYHPGLFRQVYCTNAGH